MGNYSIKKTDARENRYEYLCEATGKGHTSQALDTAATYYLKMAGDNTAHPKGKLRELIEAAEERGSLTPMEIAEILDSDELPIQAGFNYSINQE